MKLIIVGIQLMNETLLNMNTYNGVSGSGNILQDQRGIASTMHCSEKALWTGGQRM